MVNASEYVQNYEHEIIKRTRLELTADIAYFTLSIIVTTNGSSQKSNQAFIADM